MDDGTRKPAGMGRWILLGCAVVGSLGLLAVAGFAGIFYFIYTGTSDIAAVGAEYLRRSPEVGAKFGDEPAVKRSWTNSRVSVRNDAGDAQFTYAITGTKGGGNAEVWLTKGGGRWTAVRARVAPPDGPPFDVFTGPSSR